MSDSGFEPEFKQTGSGGRGDSRGDGTPGGESTLFLRPSPRKAGVMIQATVEHIGLAGETELAVTVKWPASTFCAQPCKKPDEPDTEVPGNGPQAPIVP